MRQYISTKNHWYEPQSKLWTQVPRQNCGESNLYLIESGSDYLSPKMIRDGARGKKIYFGTGLASSKEESLGFGFEFLNTMLTSLVLMKDLGANGVLHEIGTVGYNISEHRRRCLVDEQLRLIENMTRNLGIKGIYNVETSHSYHGRDLFKRILQDVKMKMHLFNDLPNFQRYGHYTVIQLAQMKFLYDTEKATVKVGWTVGNNPVLEKCDYNRVTELINRGRLNEYYFDSIYRYVFPDDEFSFIYTSPGMDIINGRKYAPYTVTTSQHRPLLTDPIKPYILSVPDSKHKRNVLKSYEKDIVMKWEHLFGGIESSDYISDYERLVNKLQYIQNMVLGVNTIW